MNTYYCKCKLRSHKVAIRFISQHSLHLHWSLNKYLATLTDHCEIDFGVPGLGFLEIDPAPVDAGVGDLDIFKTKFSRSPLRYEVGAAAKHVFVWPPLRLTEVSLTPVHAEIKRCIIKQESQNLHNINVLT